MEESSDITQKYLERLNTIPDISSSVILKRKDGKYINFICKDYEQFNSFLAESLITSNIENQLLFLDCTRTPYHSLIFDIDISINTEDRFDALLHYFNKTFINVFFKYTYLSNATFILAMPKNRLGGMHIHVPGFAITHDDYIHLHELMQPECNITNKNHTKFRLDCPSTFCLVASAKPKSGKDGIYIPVQVIHAKYHFYIFRHTTVINIANIDSFEYVKTKTEEMTPIPKKDWKVLYFPTRIDPSKTNDYHFMSYLNDRKYSFRKGEKLEIGQSREPYLMNFFKQHAMSILPLSHFNRVTKTWHYRFTNQYRIDNGIFKKTNFKIRQYCIHLRDEINPLQTILSQEESIIPVFFALYNEKARKTTKEEIIEALTELNPACKKILMNHPLVQTNTPFNLTFDTILRCAYRTYPMKTKEGCFGMYIGMGWNWIFENTTEFSEMYENVKKIQKFHFPMVKKDEKLYVWKPVIDLWEMMDYEKCIQTFKDVYSLMRCFEGFYKLPMKTRMKLNDETLWTVIAINKMEELQNGKNIECTCAPLPNDLKEMREMYGRNVPEYYMFDLEMKDFLKRDEIDM